MWFPAAAGGRSAIVGRLTDVVSRTWRRIIAGGIGAVGSHLTGCTAAALTVYIDLPHDKYPCDERNNQRQNRQPESR